MANFGDRLIGFAATADGLQQFTKDIARITVDAIDDLLADHAAHRIAEGFSGCWIGFDNFL